MNAIALTILLHYYWSTDPYKSEVSNSEHFYTEAEMKAIQSLKADHLLEENGRSAKPDKITAKGRVHIEALLAAPLPVQKFVSPLTGGET